MGVSQNGSKEGCPYVNLRLVLFLLLGTVSVLGGI